MSGDVKPCLFCLKEYTGHHMVDCPGLMPPASHVPAMAMPGVEDGEDDETPAEARQQVPMQIAASARAENRVDGCYMVDMHGYAWRWNDDSGWVCVEFDDVTGTD